MEKKIIQLPEEKKQNAKPKEKKKREIVNNVNWKEDLDALEVLNELKEIKRKNKLQGDCQLVYKELSGKRSSYMHQDKKKEHYDKERFIKIDEIIEKILNCEGKCFYCKQNVQIIYENVREPLQWSLERLSNEEGHNVNNVEISCLSCNLRRKTMHFERYKFTKDMVLVKKEDSV